MGLFSVFHQFSGRYGPSCINIYPPKELLFVGLYEFRTLEKEAAVVVLNFAGEQLTRLVLNQVGPELTGLSLVGGSDSMVSLYLTEESLGGCHRILVNTAKADK